MSIGIIIGSTRPGRIGPKITQWIVEYISGDHNLDFEIIDLSEWDLPLFNEPGFIFVTPQYNWGYPAGLKNAVDYLYNEWKGKPAIIASYANRGGGKAADQFRQVLTGLHMRLIETMPAITLEKDIYGEDGVIKDNMKSLISIQKLLTKPFRNW